MAAIFIRQTLMNDTLSGANNIAADRQPEPQKLSDFLPDAMKNEDAA